MRIVLINNFARITGGADQNYTSLCAELTRRGHDVHLVSTQHQANIDIDGAFIAARVTHQNRGALAPSEKLRVAAEAIWNRRAAAATRAALEVRPDVVHVHQLYPQLSVAPVVEAARAGTPIVQTLHDFEMISASHTDSTGSWYDSAEVRPSYRALNTATLVLRKFVQAPRVLAWITCSRFMQRIYHAHGIEAEVLPYFVEQPHDTPNAYEAREGAAFIGRLHPEKGVDDVISVAKTVPSLKVTVAGYGPMERAVRDAAARLPNLFFAGTLSSPEVFALLRRSRLALMPSRWDEPGGIAALEAMAVGTPVIAYGNGGLAEYVGDAGCGEVIRADSAELAREAAVIASDRAAWTARSSRGPVAIQARHTSTGYVDRVERMYETVISGHPRTPRAS